MEENKESVIFSKNTVTKDIICESSCDYVLPDYKADVRKVLCTSAELIPSSKFFDMGEISASGVVAYNIIYLDSENKISGMDFTSDYDLSMKCAAEEYEDSYIDSHIANLSVRLTGPRKFSAKAKISSNVTVLEGKTLKTEGDAFSRESDVQTQKQSISVAKIRRFYSEEREFAEKLADFDATPADDIKIITSAAKVNVESVYMTDGGAYVKGDIAVNCLFQNGELPPVAETLNIPFEEKISAEGISSVSYLDAEGLISSLRTEVNPEEFGCNITADVIAELSLTVYDNSEVSAVTDAYMLTAKTEPEISIFGYDEHLALIKDRASHDFAKDRAELGLANAREIIYVDADAKIDNAAPSGRECTVDGEIRFCGIAGEMNDEGNIGYINFKAAVPYFKNIKLDIEPADGASAECKIDISNVKAFIDRDKIIFSCDIVLTISLSEGKKIEYLSSLNISEAEDEAKPSSRVSVYYPERGETLFEIAKKFRTTVDDIAISNSLTDAVMNSSSQKGALAGVKKLIIK